MYVVVSDVKIVQGSCMYRETCDKFTRTLQMTGITSMAKSTKEFVMTN